MLKNFLTIATSLLLMQQGFTQVTPPAYNTSSPLNYVRTWNAKMPIANPSGFDTKPVQEVQQATQYLDGLGRSLQTVIKQGALTSVSGVYNDLVSPVYYDVLGNQSLQFLPFAAATTDGNFKYDAYQQQSTYYSGSNSPIAGQGETWYYGQTNFESSPLNRVKKTMPAGNSWVQNNRGIEAKYFNNTTTDDVKKWIISEPPTIGDFGTITYLGAYTTGLLNKYISVDEAGHQVIEFKDNEGKIVLKKVQLTAVADDGTGSGYTNWLCTYYLYDGIGNLRCVVQPRGVELLILNSWNIYALNNDILNEQCFRYEYDQRNRMIVKHVPGAQPVYMVYDNRDRLVLTQDGNMRSGNPQKWLYMQYDQFNRPISTGLWQNSSSIATHYNAAYNSSSYPNLFGQNFEVLSQTFYDNYSWLGNNGNPFTATLNTADNGYFDAASNSFPYPQAVIQSNDLKGRITGTKIKVLGSNTYLYTISFYDEKGRLIQSESQNITGGIDISTTQYSWSGQSLMTIMHQENAATPQTTVVVTKTTYDNLGRLIITEKKLANTLVNNNAMSPYKIIAQYDYNAKGQLINKNLAPTYNSGGLEKLKYDYNIQGWMLGMNRDYAKDLNSTNYFGFDLGYDKANNNIIGNETYQTPQYNGNIEGMVWKSKGDGEKRKYDFLYDEANRIIKADFNQYTGGTFNKIANVDFSMTIGTAGIANSAYDANGNIKAMKQNGLMLNTSPVIDDFSYSYKNNQASNRLLAVTESAAINTTDNKLGDFTDKNTTADDYDYDGNGNLLYDKNKAISNIAYNHLNLPSVITVTGKGSISYTYDATGNKLKKQTIDNSTAGKTITTTTTYLNGFVYESKTTVPADANNPDYANVLQFLGQEEGRIRFKTIDASFQYDYFIKDHLGNVRMVLTEEDRQDTYPATTLESATYNGGKALSIEKQYYNIDNGNIVPVPTEITGVIQNNNGNPPYNNNPYSNTSANSNSIYQLNASTNNKIGLGITLKVMAGDHVNIYGKSYFKTPAGGYTSTTSPLSVLDILNSLTATSTIAAKGVNATQIEGGFPTAVTNIFSNQPDQTTNTPRAFINWIILDEQFKYVSAGFDQTGTSGVVKPHDINTIPTISIPKNGYIYVYCSNESQYNVFFDNLQVIHTRGQILEETHYYPFGLPMAGISSRAAGSLENRYKFNEGTERNTDLELNWDETDFRGYDAQIGRFLQSDELSNLNYDFSPYAYANNNPISLNDPFGLIAEDAIAANAIVPKKPKYKLLPEVVVVGHLKTSSSVGEPGFLESLIPVWGPGRTAVNDFQNGRWGWGIFNSLMTVADVVTLGGMSTIVKGGVKALVRTGVKEVAEEGTEQIFTKATQRILLNEGINVTEEGFIHVIQRHYPRSGMFLSKSKFSINAREIVDMIKNSAQVPKVLQRGGNYQRIVDAGRTIGVDAITGQATSKFTIITNAAGDLITSFPGLPGR